MLAFLVFQVSPKYFRMPSVPGGLVCLSGPLRRFLLSGGRPPSPSCCFSPFLGGGFGTSRSRFVRGSLISVRDVLPVGKVEDFLPVL